MKIVARLLVLSQLLSLCSGLTIKLTRISTQFNFPIGIDYHEPSNSIITTANYPGGEPSNFVRVDFQGRQYPWSTIHGLTDEVKLATVRSRSTASGFKVGDLFGGTGVSGHVIKVTDNGQTSVNPWCALGNVGLMRGSLWVDHTGIYEYKLIVATTDGYVYKIDSECRSPELMARITHNGGAVHLEGVTIVPNNSTKYGALAGKIIIGAEGLNRMYTVDAAKNVNFYATVSIEDLDLIEEGENFFGINYGTGYLLGAGWEQWIGHTDKEGVILATSEGGQLYELTWDGSAPKFTQISFTSDSATVSQWEHVAFAPAGIREILPADFSLCVELTTSTNSVPTNISPLVFSGYSTILTQYTYNSFIPRSGSPSTPGLQANTILMFFAQDYTNTFTLNIFVDSPSDGTGGSATLVMQSNNLGNMNILLQDDPQTGTIESIDFLDSYYLQNGNGRFSWQWGANTNDGTSIEVDFVTQNDPFDIVFYFDGVPTGIQHWKWIYRDINGVQREFNVPLGDRLILNRRSCTCNNNQVDSTFEKCDGSACCTNKCTFQPASTVCRGANGGCDVPEFCTGSSGNCPADSFQPSSLICRASAGVCDVPEFCPGNAAGCPADTKKQGDVCRSAKRFCDVAEVCNGVNVDCPIDGFQDNGIICPDPTNCTSVSHCLDGYCVGPDTRCNGTCGDGIKAQSEECDDGNDNNNDCCTNNCKFASDEIVCRASTARCDPAEKCTGNSGECPADVNNQCPVCDRDCGSDVGDGTCILDGVCECNPGHTGPNCSTPVCDIYSNCSSCSTNRDCGWCCGQNRCLPNTAETTCGDTWLGHSCDCTPSCANGGTCTCGTCECVPPYGGPGCSQIYDCYGNLTDIGNPDIPVTDVCNVCDGNGTSCLGCDGVPFGKQYDRCGECGGNGEGCFTLCPFTNCKDCAGSDEYCFWCPETQTCHMKSSNISCIYRQTDKGACGGGGFLDDPAKAAAVGVSAGVVAGIVIGAVAFLVVGAIGGKKGYDVWMRNRESLAGAQTNPMYKDDHLKGSNPFYTDEDIELSTT